MTGPLDAHAAPTACSCTSAAAVVLAATCSKRAPNGPTIVVPEPQPTATDPRSSKPVPSSPIDVTHLQYELLHHPNRNFVNSLTNTLKFGARIGYSGHQKARVSRNLILASQHPEVVSSNSSKEIQLGRVAGPFLSSPLKDLQCHLVGIVRNIPRNGEPSTTFLTQRGTVLTTIIYLRSHILFSMFAWMMPYTFSNPGPWLFYGQDRSEISIPSDPHSPR